MTCTCCRQAFLSSIDSVAIFCCWLRNSCWRRASISRSDCDAHLALPQTRRLSSQTSLFAVVSVAYHSVALRWFWARRLTNLSSLCSIDSEVWCSRETARRLDNRSSLTIHNDLFRSRTAQQLKRIQFFARSFLRMTRCGRMYIVTYAHKMVQRLYKCIYRKIAPVV